MKESHILNIETLGKTFSTSNGGSIEALRHVDLDVDENEFLCIVGPSGCGKSTLLRIVAGLEQMTKGRILRRGLEITGAHRDVGMVFQEYSLLPWRNVLDNVALGPEFAGAPKKARRETALACLRLVGMESFSRAFPHELSGGMRQRVAIARALANNPDILLMDEPFGALDAHTRILMQKELLRVWEAHRKTILFVTHGVDEAIYLADRILVMSARPGRIIDIFNVDMPRPRRRSDPVYGQLAEKILNLLEKEAALSFGG
ncbi:MAG: ABC transporter ATP-binding protein [Deltaproteobacteria bacterium]|nr:ABC transporter ATP-binding protein [Deltaproteobacteria bacterium]